VQKPRKKKCRNPDCGEWFQPWNTLQKACSPACALVVGRQEQERQKKRELRQRKEEAKTRRKWMAEAQTAFNAFIRERDKDEPCICCGQWADEGWKPGGSWDAGHFKSVGAHPELRFEELNCHKQLKSCNAGEGKYAGKARTVNQGYTERLPTKIGQEAFDWLNGPHEPKKYTIDDLKAIKAKYKEKLRELRKESQ
jgi:hypothetical protein